jgi:hypothetical protein
MKTKLLFGFMLIMTVASNAQKSNDNLSKKNISVEKLLAVNNVEDLLNNFPKNKYTVMEFKLTIMSPGKDLAEFAVTGNKFSDQVKSRLKTLQPHDEFYIEFVRGRLLNSADESTRLFNPVSYIIADR